MLPATLCAHGSAARRDHGSAGLCDHGRPLTHTTATVSAGEFGDRLFGAGVVDQVLAVGGGGDERIGGGVVERPGQAVGDPVQPGHGVVGEQGLFSFAKGQVVAQVGRDSPMSVALIVKRVAMRWSKAAPILMRGWRDNVGCPIKMSANGDAPRGGPPTAVMIEEVADFLNGPVDPALQEVVHAALGAEQLVIADGDPSHVAGAAPSLQLLKTSRYGLALQPEQSEGVTVFRDQLSRDEPSTDPRGSWFFRRQRQGGGGASRIPRICARIAAMSPPGCPWPAQHGSGANAMGSSPLQCLLPSPNEFAILRSINDQHHLRREGQRW